MALDASKDGWPMMTAAEGDAIMLKLEDDPQFMQR